jgi:hypothetical protein
MVSKLHVEEYEVLYSSNKFVPRILLKSEGKYIGQLIFNTDNTTLPSDSLENGQLNMYYHMQNFQDIINILRNDKPIFIEFTGTDVNDENCLRTSSEPVGKFEKK